MHNILTDKFMNKNSITATDSKLTKFKLYYTISYIINCYKYFMFLKIKCGDRQPVEMTGPGTDGRVPGLIKSVGQHQPRQKLDITDRDLN